MRRILIILFLLSLVTAPTVFAETVLQGDTCTVTADTVIEGNLFALCRTLIVDGVVRGHLYSISAAAQINGSVEGSVYLLGGQAAFAGRFAGNLHFIGGLMQIAPSAQMTAADGSLTALSLSITAAAPVPGSISAAGYQMILNEGVEREVNFWGTALEIDAALNGNVSAQVGSQEVGGAPELLTLLRILAPEMRVVSPGLRLSGDAIIAGTLRYSAPAEADFGRSLPNPVEYIPMQSVVTLPQGQDLPDGFNEWFGRFATELLLSIILGLLVAAVGSRLTSRAADTIGAATGGSLLVGAGSLLLTIPVLAMIIVLSLVVIVALSALRLPAPAFAAGFVISALGIGLTSAFVAFGVFIARMVAAYTVGRWLVRRISRRAKEEEQRFALSMLAGVVLIAALMSLPYVGWLFSVAASFLGTGAVLLTAYRGFRPAAAPTPLRQRSTRASLALPAPPPIAEDAPEAPGMDNLPDGFTWWDES
ncbi:MAG: hypothetical protein L6Q98_09965 [Anaerolineae bacterium]|nr:hypothetical protein [Anaerolineae bacterium]NUQ03125.1 hypothetical protein [Anaerolineae bacterium]